MQDTHLKKRQLDAVDLDIRIQKGHPQPYGATSQVHGVNFSVFSRHATSVTLVLFRPGELEPALQISLDPAINRTGDVWHIMVTGLEPGFEYGYRLDRADNEAPEIHRFDPGAVVFDPYARALSGPSLWQETQRRAAREGHWRGLVVDEPFDWEGQRPLNRHLADTIIYELHVRGFTKDPSAGIEAGGTFRGLIEKIPYLQELGITAVELLPVTEFDEADNYRKNPLTGERLHNYWGYHPLGWFAPKAAYANSPEAGAQVREFKELVKAFHSAGIEVILDMVFNHTGEGNEKGPTLCFRGLDNSVYYMVNEENGEYANYSGCGNTVNCNHPVVRDLIVDCLCYWVTEMHVDGFRFDLASILGRGPDGEVLANPPLLERIAAHPILADTKLIAEAWDAAGLYQVGTFPNFGRWAEWNGKFRDDIRRFVHGEPGMVSVIATRLAGSSDLYQESGRAPYHSINFVTSHDGFTLADLVSYNEKHNEANGEYNSDGDDHNFSRNHGAEGETDDPEIIALREQQMRNFAALLLMAHGVPMILAGDEMARSQGGNNNTWCQDNPVSWLDWRRQESEADLLRFFRHLIAFRHRHEVLRPQSFEGDENGGRRLAWHGTELGEPDWSEESHSLGMHLQGFAEESEIYLIAHAGEETADFELPVPLEGRRWQRFVDTSLPGVEASREPGEEVELENQEQYTVEPQSVVILVSAE